ncbi:MAG: segregation and condensation protein A [Planctomycetota bacterium]
MVTTDYTVLLDQVFQGPMDLLLHLVREQEVEIHEVEIGLIVEAYLAYLKQIESLDIELAGDFAVMSATLMALKSRSLLPQDELDFEDEFDPRDELIQRLMEYRKFKAAAGTLEELGLERESMHERGFKGELKTSMEQPTFDIGELTVWDLWSTYSRLQRETAGDQPHRIIKEGRPMRFFVERAVNLIKISTRTTLKDLVAAMGDEESERDNVIGSFCALLELVKMGVLCVEQESTGGELGIALRDDREFDIDQVVANAGFDDEMEPTEDGEEDPEAGSPKPAGEAPDEETDVEPESSSHNPENQP